MRQNSENLVSVIVPTYNRAYCLARTLNSVLAQTHKDVEIIVIDDGSLDNTSELMNAEYSNEPKVRYYYQKNQGVSAARNYGINLSQGQYIAFLDSDDMWKPWKLELQIRALNFSPKSGMIWTDMEAINPSGKVISINYLKTMYHAYKWFDDSDLFEEEHSLEKIAPFLDDIVKGKRLFIGNIFSQMIMGNLVHTSTVLLRRNRLDKVKAFNEEFNVTGEDYDFHLRTCREGYVAFVDVSSIYYQTGLPDQLTRPSYNVEMACSFLRTVEPFLSKDKDIIKLPRWMINTMLADANHWMGESLCDKYDYKKARKYLLRSLRYKFKQPRVLAFLLLATLPKRTAISLREFYRVLKDFR